MRRALLCSLVVVVGCSAEARPTVVGDLSEPIVDGTPTRGEEPAVVLVYDRSGGLCSGTLIAPRVVLTAKHCVQRPGATGPTSAGNFIVGVGDSIRALSLTFTVQAVRTTPGVYSSGRGGLGGALVGIDVGLLTLTTGASAIEPIPVRRESPSSLIGDRATTVGFGQIPSGSAGTKYIGSTVVSGLMGGVIYTPPAICEGDSGGPLISEDRQVFGVASFGNGGCGSGINGYNRVDTFLEMIDEVIADSGSCLNDGAERCDSFDNDCDDMVDEGCKLVGETCATVDECVGGPDGSLRCEDSPAGRICTQPCNPTRPSVGCGPGLYCAHSAGCDGLCVFGEAGPGRNEEPCSADTDCASLACLDPGDGIRRCVTPCAGDTGVCLAGEVCAALPGACGGCVSESIVSGRRGLGEACTADADCASMTCFVEGGDHYCTRSCTMDTDCGDGFHCRDGDAPICVRGAREGIGSSCRVNEDCHDGGFCATRAGVSWCTDFCPPAECPTGYTCESVGEGVGVCAPERGLPGEGCVTGDDCLSGLCIAVTEMGEQVCTRYCGADTACGPGFECQRTADGATAVCVPTLMEPAGGGGGCGVGGRPSHVAAALVLLALILSFRRRRS